MCGFAWFTYQNEKLLENVSQTLKSRAIDDDYSYYDEWLSFYHAHLKISDLDKNTSQPLIWDHVVVWLVGEIYNKKHLLELVWIEGNAEDYTELQTIALCYEKLWENFINYVNGEFTIFIYDKTKSEYFLFRDRWGVNNAYYRIYKNQFYFASEMKALILQVAEVDRNAFIEYMTFQFSISPNTIVKDVKTLRPGTYAVFKDGKLFLKDFKPYEYTETGNIIETIEASICRRIPHFQKKIFISLSGWPDSNLILYFLDKHYQWEIIAYTFCTDENKSEVVYAVENAKKLWIQHLLIDMNAYNFQDKKQDIYHHEWLLKSPNLWRIIREKYPEYNSIKVEFWWDGKEELILGNNHFPYESIQERYEYFRSKDMINTFDINQEFLNKEMFDFNLQMIDKITLRNGLERRMPFTDYELLRFFKYQNYRQEAEDFLKTKWMSIIQGEYWYNIGTWFQYNFSPKEAAKDLFSQLNVLDER